MIAIHKVLIPTDLSDGSRQASLRAAGLASQFGAEVHLLHVILMAESAPLYPMLSVGSDTKRIYDQLTENAEQRLAALAEELAVPEDRLKTIVRHGNFAAPEILDYAKEIDCDLIAMGTHGRRGFRHFLLGSVAEEVVRKAECAVATFRPEAAAEPAQVRRILAPVDLSNHSPAVVSHAKSLAELYGAQLDFVHIVAAPSLPAYYDAYAAPVYSNLEETEVQAKKALEELVESANLEGIPYEMHVRRGIPDQQIVSFAKERESDLMVMASHGLTGLSHVLLGSVAEKVLRQAPCPVLTVHASGKSLASEEVA